MDRLQRRNPRSGPSNSSSMKPPRPPRGPPFQVLEASRPLPKPSSPGGRLRKKVRFASEASSHQICMRQDANTGKAKKIRLQGCDGKTMNTNSLRNCGSSQAVGLIPSPNKAKIHRRNRIM